MTKLEPTDIQSCIDDVEFVRVDRLRVILQDHFDKCPNGKGWLHCSDCLSLKEEFGVLLK